MEVFKNQTVYFDGYDLTGDSNSLTFEQGADALDATTFSTDATKKNVPGLLTVSMGLQGFWNSSPVLGIDTNIGAASKLVSFETLGAAGATDNNSYMFKALVGGYNASGNVDGIFPFSFSAAAAGRLLRGKFCEKQTGIIATGNGTIRTLGAVSSVKSLYAGMHILAVSGTNPTLSLAIKSSATGAFAGEETLRLTMTTATALGSELKSVAGAITDTFWRPTWTIGGTATPTFSFILNLAIV